MAGSEVGSAEDERDEGGVGLGSEGCLVGRLVLADRRALNSSWAEVIVKEIRGGGGICSRGK